MTSQPTVNKTGNDPGGPGEPGAEGSGLQAGLKNRHLSMIAIGGVIGAGLFVGSSSGIATAGPGILLSYALVGTLVVLVMRMLGEMSAANPTSAPSPRTPTGPSAPGPVSPSAGCTGSSGSSCSPSKRPREP